MLERMEDILSEETINKIKQLNILLIGIGGVGGFALESLVRLGIENITIVDFDILEESNLNRQIIATKNTLNKYKVEIAYERALSINPTLNIKTIKEKIDKNNYLALFNEKYDYVLDACDTITTKILLINYCLNNNIKIVSCMGMGNRLNPLNVELTDIWQTNNDPVSKVIRKELKKLGINSKVPVVWSSELPIKNKNRTPSSIILVPASAGLNLVYYILKDLIKN